MSSSRSQPLRVRCACGAEVTAPDSATMSCMCPECGQQVSLSRPDGMPPRRKRRREQRSPSTGGLPPRPGRLLTRCPHCDEKQKKPAEKLGRESRCKACGEMFTVRRLKKKADDSGNEITPWYDGTNNLRKRGEFDREKYSKDWDHVSTGLNRFYWGVLAFDAALLIFTATIFAVLLALSFVLLRFGNGEGKMLGFAIVMTMGVSGLTLMRVVLMTAEQYFYHSMAFCGFVVFMTFLIGVAPGLIAPLLWLAGGLSVGGGITMIVGLVSCLLVPMEARIRPLIISAMLLLGVTIATHVFLMMAVHGGGAAQEFAKATEFRLAGFSTMGLATATHILLVLFLGGIPRYFGDEPTCDHIREYLMFFIGMTVASILCSLLIVFNADSPIFALVLSIVLLGMSLFLALRFLSVVSAARDIIRPYFRG